MEVRYKMIIIRRSYPLFGIFKTIRKALQKIMPKFREETLYAIAFTVIVLDLLNYQLFLRPLGALILSPLLIAYLLSIIFALTEFQIEKLGAPTKIKHYILVYILAIAFLTEFYIGINTSAFWYRQTPKELPSLFDRIIIMFSIINMVHSFVILLIIRSQFIHLEELYISGNANKIVLAVCSVVILIVLILGNYNTPYPYYVLGSIALSFCSIIIGFENWIEVKKG